MQELEVKADALIAQVSGMRQSVDNAVSVITDLAQAVRDAAGDPAAVQRVADKMDEAMASLTSETQDLSASASSNDPTP